MKAWQPDKFVLNAEMILASGSVFIEEREPIVPFSINQVLAVTETKKIIHKIMGANEH